MANTKPLKRCPSCGEEFSLRDFISNPQVIPKGMSFESDNPDLNLYYFHHDTPGCGTTLAIPVSEFVGLINEPLPEQNLAQTEVCENHCVSVHELSACGQKCTYAPYRRLLLAMIDVKTETDNEPV